MGKRSIHRWLLFSAVVVGTAAVVGWQTGLLRQWSSYGQMALFRWTLTKAINRDGVRWTVQRSGVIGKEVWIFELRRETKTDLDPVAGMYLSFLPSPDAARDQFKRSGNQFVAPVLTSRIKGQPAPPVPFDPPIISDISLPGLAEGNFVWNGYGSNMRGVIKFRQGRVIGQINAPSLVDAEQLGRNVAGLLAER